MERRVRSKRSISAQIRRSERSSSSKKALTKKQKLSPHPHPQEKLALFTISRFYRFLLTLVGLAVVGASLWDASVGILRGDSTVYYFDLPIIFGVGIIVVGVTGYFPSFPEFNARAPITSDMLVEITKAVFCLIPVLIAMTLIQSLVENQGYKREPSDRSLSRKQRHYAPTMFSKIYELPVKVESPGEIDATAISIPIPHTGQPVKVESPREIDPTAISIPFPHTGQRQLFLTYDTALDGPLSAARVQERMKETGAIGIKIEGEVTEEEWAAFCAESSKLSPPVDFLNCGGKIPTSEK